MKSIFLSKIPLTITLWDKNFRDIAPEAFARLKNKIKEPGVFKPLLAHLIENSSKSGDIVLDLFGGSGSTLIACEQLQRKCRMIELDAHYCDVILTRWERFTGKAAELLQGE